MSDDLFLRDLWYMAGLARPLLRGDMKRVMLLGEPVLIGRMTDGEVFALRDICPHRGVPLSAGRVMPEDTVECPYHGWRFKADGAVLAHPLARRRRDRSNPTSIRVRAYPVREQDGLIWVYMAAQGRESTAPASEPPRVPVPQRQAALERKPDLPLRHRSRRDRPDGSRARALRARPLVVARARRA